MEKFIYIIHLLKSDVFMKRKILSIVVLMVFLISGITSLTAVGQKATFEKKINTYHNAITKTTDKIQLTNDEINQFYSWSEIVKDTNLKRQIKNSLVDTIDSSGELCISKLEERLIQIKNNYNIRFLGILPAIAIVRCNWDITSDSAGERTINFWVFGFGSHTIRWDTLDDFNGDGIWDLGPGTPWYYEWFALFFPLRHFDDWAAWSGYPGRAKVQVDYTIDGNPTFQEPANDLQINDLELQTNFISNQLNVQNNFICRSKVSYNILCK